MMPGDGTAAARSAGQFFWMPGPGAYAPGFMLTSASRTADRNTREYANDLFDAALAAAQEIDQDKLRKVIGVREVSLAVGHGSHLLDEFDEIKVAGQHEGIDHDA